VDLIPYDATLPRALIELKNMNTADVPQMSCGSLMWSGVPEDKTLIRKFLFREVRDVIYKHVTDGKYRIASLADLPQESEVAQDSKPTFREDNFKLTHPMEDDMLPILQLVRATSLVLNVGGLARTNPTYFPPVCVMLHPGPRHVGRAR
jgi:hypothetical protein